MIKRAYDWTMRMAAHRKAPQALFWVAFAESSFFPIPPDVMLIPMVLAQRAKAWLYAGICTVGSVLGGIGGYAIGYFLFETLGRWLINVYGLGAQFEAYRADYAEWGLWIILLKGLCSPSTSGCSSPPRLSPAPAASIWSPACSTGWASRSASSSSGD
jgi:membrane protein YqaA with SNARE-associated domain